MGERKQVEATTNRLPSFPCSAVVERSDSAECTAGGGLAGGELVDASTAPFNIRVSCAWDSGVSMCASLDATLKELREDPLEVRLSCLYELATLLYTGKLAG